mmetsp:Transcript_6572/g.26775  ORF Transcript_6572/g.26775 Transcript_6572/m.26775 type:complete len:213 (-) Transcript_6572:911-1549(-)
MRPENRPKSPKWSPTSLMVESMPPLKKSSPPPPPPPPKRSSMAASGISRLYSGAPPSKPPAAAAGAGASGMAPGISNWLTGSCRRAAAPAAAVEGGTPAAAAFAFASDRFAASRCSSFFFLSRNEAALVPGATARYALSLAIVTARLPDVLVTAPASPAASSATFPHASLLLCLWTPRCWASKDAHEATRPTTEVSVSTSMSVALPCAPDAP